MQAPDNRRLAVSMNQVTVHELPADQRMERCPRCGVRFEDMNPDEALTEDPGEVTCTLGTEE